MTQANDSTPWWKRWFAIPSDYGSRQVWRDFNAGLTVSVLLIPQSLAYALLAGLPPVYGLYASLVPLLTFALLSSTPHVSVGPTALASILSLSALAPFANVSPDEYLRLCLLLAGLTGLVQLLLGVLRLGILVNFLSRPVISGFVSAAAVLIFCSQIKTLLGLSFGRTSYFHETISLLVQNIGSLHLLSAGIGIGSLLLLPSLQRWLKGWPVILFFIASTTALAAYFNWDQQGLAILKQVPNGLPHFNIPSFSKAELLALLPAALILGLISFVETLSIGKTFQDKHDYYRISANRELIALGASKLLGSLFMAFPTSASFSRSAVSEKGGAVTALSSIVTVIMLACCALFLMPLFYYLPMPVLAAIIILSVVKLFNWREMRRLWILDKKEWSTLMVTFLVTLFGGLQFGIAAGVVLSLIFFVIKSTTPHLAELGRLPNTNAFRNVNRFEQVETTPDILIVRFDAELFFGNADYFHNQLLALIRKKGKHLQLLIIDAHTINNLDSSGAYAINTIVDFLEKNGTKLYLAGAIGPVRDKLYRFGIMNRIGSNHQFLSIQSALDHYHKRKTADDDWARPAVQHD